MSLQVFINDEEIELKNQNNIGLTYQVGSILNLSGRSGNLSNKFKVPKTKINTRILGYLLNINSGSDIPYKRNKGQIIQNGVELFPDGLAIVESSGKDYELTIYSGNVSFFDLIKGRNISDLDWADSCHFYTIPVIIDSFTNNSDYIYPIVDWGNGVELLDNTDLQNANSLLPCARTSVILEKIVASTGYELKGTFKNTDQYTRHLTSPNKFGFSESEINANSGTASNVTTLIESKTIESTCINPAPFAEVIPLDYNTIAWDAYTLGKFIPDNSYYGTFNLYAEGEIENFIPIGGENQIDNDATADNATWDHGHINDTHACYTSSKNLVNDLIVRDLATGSSSIVLTQNGAINWGVGMTETSGGYIAFSDEILSNSRVRLYEIATGITTTIYTEAISVGLTNIIEYIKIWDGKVAWYNNGGSGSTEGIWIYDIGTATTKNVTLSLNIGQVLDHNGSHLVWEDLLTDDISIFDFAAGTNSVIENAPGAAFIKSLHVLGDYATYYTDNGDNMQSFKISTSTLVTAKNGVGIFNPGSSRTETALAFCGQDKQLYYYDLLTDTLTTTIETDCTAFNNDDQISLNDSYISYQADSDKDIRYYDILAGTITTISTSTEQKQKVIVGKSDIIFYWAIGSDDFIRHYDILAGTFFTNIDDIVNNQIFVKALNNDRLLFSNANSSDDPTTRISYINPLKNPLSVTYVMQIKEDGILVYSQNVTPFGSGVYLETLNTGNVLINAASEYTAHFIITAIKDETISYFTDYELDVSTFSFQATSRIPYGAKLDFATLFDWNQDKLLKDILNQYSLTIQTNEITKQVLLTPLDDLVLNLGKARKWSDKVNLLRSPTIKFRLSGYAQRNYFTYSPDDDVEEEFGEGYFDIADTSLEAETDIIVLNSAAAVNGFRVEDHHTPEIPFLTGPGNSFEKKLTRHLLLDPEDQTLNLKNTDTPETGSTFADIPFAYFKKSGKADSLDFQSLLDDNYTVLLGMTKNIKFVSLLINLREVDVQNIDFTIPVELDIHISDIHINGFFYINKISNFKNSKSTKVDLIRL